MSPYKQYNPNTKYGRRKAREQAEYNIQHYTPEEKKEYNKINCGCQVALLLIFLLICSLILIISGPDALKHWLK
jgi:hypothetical protein